MNPNEIVRSGHYYFGLGYLILAEDGLSPFNGDPDLPRDVLRVTVGTGRQLDLTGSAADEMRRHLDEVSRPAPPSGSRYAHGRKVQSSEPPVRPRRRSQSK